MLYESFHEYPRILKRWSIGGISYSSCIDSENRAYMLILLGPPGAGKTLLAVGLGIEALQKGFQLYFITIGESIHILKTEGFTHRSQIQLKRLRTSDLIIIDDVMYMLHGQSSLILTSNRSPEECTELQFYLTIHKILVRLDLSCFYSFYFDISVYGKKKKITLVNHTLSLLLVVFFCRLFLLLSP